jgi:hypothetical protein
MSSPSPFSFKWVSCWSRVLISNLQLSVPVAAVKIEPESKHKEACSSLLRVVVGLHSATLPHHRGGFGSTTTDKRDMSNPCDTLQNDVLLKY